MFAQDKGSFDPAKGPLFNKDAFEPVSAFNFYYGQGQPHRGIGAGFGYHNQDLSFIKNTRMAGGTNVQIRFEIFNLWNWHMFSNAGDVWRPRLQQQPGEPGFRQMERIDHRAADDAGGGAVRVLAGGSRFDVSRRHGLSSCRRKPRVCQKESEAFPAAFAPRCRVGNMSGLLGSLGVVS